MVISKLVEKDARKVPTTILLQQTNAKKNQKQKRRSRGTHISDICVIKKSISGMVPQLFLFFFLNSQNCRFSLFRTLRLPQYIYLVTTCMHLSSLSLLFFLPP